MVACRPLIIVLGCWWGGVTSVAAQTLRGRVVDEQLETPVLVASAVLIDDSGKVRRAAITDSAGVFTLHLPEPGMFSIRVDSPGYATLRVPPFDVGPHETVEFVIKAGYYETFVDPASVRRSPQPGLNGSRQRGGSPRR